jgi:acyl-homoserine lactone acylase PvdQ
VFNENNGFFNKKVTIIGNFSFAWSFLDPKIGDIVHQ